MPIITIPSDASIELDDKTHAFSFVADFINKTVLRDRQWGVTTEQLIVAMEIRTAFKSKAVGEQVSLTHDQWEKLCAVVKRPPLRFRRTLPKWPLTMQNYPDPRRWKYGLTVTCVLAFIWLLYLPQVIKC